MLINFCIKFSVIIAKCNTLPLYLNLKKTHLFCYQDYKADPFHIGNESAFGKVVFLWKSKLKSPDLIE